MKKDILLYISDQHAWEQGLGPDPIVRTPNLDRIAREGTAMQNCSTPYPLCVPARMAMMSGQQASHCGVMHNFAALDSNRVTFAHCLNAAGYETVLCGRMHFVGPDQRHGFARRIAGEFTPVFHNRPTGNFRLERGVHLNTPTASPACLEVIGGGNSPSLEYNRYVVREAENYLAAEHDRPQLLVVGTYAPHHPYVAPRELYEYYLDKVTVPEDSFTLPEHPAMEGKCLCNADSETIRAVRAAYYGMVEFEDRNIGRVYDAFQAYLKRTGREGVFVYVSDHGDQIGYRGYFGKNSFYEPSVHVPMVFAGAGIKKGSQCFGAVSLLDLGPTLCEVGGAPAMPDTDGVSLWPQLSGGTDERERIVFSELGGGNETSGRLVYGQMARKGNKKLIHFDGFDGEDQLFDLDSDPEETTNLIALYPSLAKEFRAALKTRFPSVEEIRAGSEKLLQNVQILANCDFDSDERWRTPPCARDYPEIRFQRKQLKCMGADSFVRAQFTERRYFA